MISSVEGRAGNASYLGEAARWTRPISSFDDDAAVRGAPESDLGTGSYPQIVANPFRDRHPAIAGHLGRHCQFQTVAFRPDTIISRGEG